MAAVKEEFEVACELNMLLILYVEERYIVIVIEEIF